MSAYEPIQTLPLTDLRANGYSLTGRRDEKNIKVAQVVGVVAGVLGAVSGMANGASTGSVIIGAVAGGAAGYAMGTLTGALEVEELGLTSKILAGAVSGTFGAGVGSLTTELVNSLGKVTGL